MTKFNYVTARSLDELCDGVRWFAEKHPDMMTMGTTFSTINPIDGTLYHQAFVTRAHLFDKRGLLGFFVSAIVIMFVCCVIGSSAGFVWWLFHR